MFRVRQWTVIALTPVSTMRFTRFRVSSWVGNSRILAETDISGGRSFRKAVRIEQRRSGLDRRAAPIPAWVEKDFGQPQLRSMPETSFLTTRAAWTARSGSAEPIW